MTARAPARRLPRRGFIEPMKAALVPAPPHDGNWLYEVKFDGIRTLAVKNGSSVELWSRNRKPLDARFPGIAAAVAKLPVASCVLDGEACALDPRGLSSFQILQNQAEGEAPLVFYVFDLPFLGADDLRGLPLLERKARLDRLLAKAREPIRSSAWFPERPEEILASIRKLGGEGAIAKRKDSLYEAGRRSGAWIKIKFVRSQEFVVVGYTLPRRSRQHFGALLLGYYEGKGKARRLLFAGRVGTGFTAKTLAETYKKLRALEIDRPRVEAVRPPSGRWQRFNGPPSEIRWVEPKLVAQIQFYEWTADGSLRHPSFLGLRDDKRPEEVVREPEPKSQSGQSEA